MKAAFCPFVRIYKRSSLAFLQRFPNAAATTVARRPPTRVICFVTTIRAFTHFVLTGVYYTKKPGLRTKNRKKSTAEGLSGTYTLVISCRDGMRKTLKPAAKTKNVVAKASAE